MTLHLSYNRTHSECVMEANVFVIVSNGDEQIDYKCPRRIEICANGLYSPILTF